MRSFLVLIALLISLSIHSEAQGTKPTNIHGNTRRHKSESNLNTSSVSTDTLRLFYDLYGKGCSPGLSSYLIFAYREDDHWRLFEYYIQDQQLLSEGTYTDSTLKVKSGTFQYFNALGLVTKRGSYFNNKKVGLWLGYDDQTGNNIDSTIYIDDIPTGRCISRYPNGEVREIRMMDRKSHGTGNCISYYETGAIRQKGIYISKMKKDSIWVNYHPNGQLSFIQQFKVDSLISQTCFDTLGNLLKECIANRPAEFPGGELKLNNYLDKRIYFPDGYDLTGKYTFLVAEYTIGLDGKVEDVKIIKPLHPDFDKIVLKAINGMPTWKPKIEFNQPVRQRIVYPVKFRTYLQ